MPAVAYKEWLKLRSWLGFVFAAHLIFAGWLFLSIRHQFRIEHAEMIYYQTSHIGNILYGDLRFLPLITGALIGAVQFLPELNRGRLRLSLHLPVGIPALVLAHMAVGLAALAVLTAVDIAALMLAVGTFYPVAFVTSALLTASPWVLAGVAAYLGAALTLLEPTRGYQAANLAIAGGVVWLCFRSPAYQAYDFALGGLVPVILLLAPAALQAAYRFRNGGL